MAFLYRMTFLDSIKAPKTEKENFLETFISKRDPLTEFIQYASFVSALAAVIEASPMPDPNPFGNMRENLAPTILSKTVGGMRTDRDKTTILSQPVGGMRERRNRNPRAPTGLSTLIRSMFPGQESKPVRDWS